MKAFKQITAEQKKWALTACLLATLSFNLSHLIDGSAGQVDMSSEESQPSDRLQKLGAGALTSVTPKVAPDFTVKKEAPAKDPNNKGKVRVDGVERDAELINVQGKAAFVIDKEYDSRREVCVTCANGVFVSDINYNDAVSNLASSMSEAEKIIINSTPKLASAKMKKDAKEVVDLSSLSVDEMTDDQKDQRADDILAEIEDTCGDIEKDDRAMKCYTSKLKTVLRDRENKKLFKKEREEKITEFINDNVKDRIGASLTSSKFSESSADQIQRLQEALPGKFQDARNLIIEASANAAKSAALTVRNKEQLVERAKARFEGSKTLEEQQRNLVSWKNQDLELQKTKFDFGPKVTSLLAQENRNGLDYAVSKDYVDDGLRDQLMDRYDELTSQVFNSDVAPAQGSLIPKRSSQFREGNSDGVHSLQMGTPLQGSVGNSMNQQNLMDNRGQQIANRPAAQNSGFTSPNGARPPAPQLNFIQ